MATPSKKPFTWSYTNLNSFETCPKRYHLTKILKAVSDPPSEEMNWGRTVHKALEDRIKRKTPLPEGMDKWEPITATIEQWGTQHKTERQLAITSGFQPTGWFEKDVWARAVLDISFVPKDQDGLAVLDYKTGKKDPSSEQLKLFAAFAFIHEVDIDKVKTGFVWLKEPPKSRYTVENYHRADTLHIWGEFLPRIKRMQEAYDTDTWPAKPSGLCRAWCPCTGCEHNGRRG